MSELEQVQKKTPRPVWSYFFSAIPSIILILGCIPVVIAFYFLQRYFDFFWFTNDWYYVLLPFVLFIGAVLLFLSELYITGGIVKLFHITYQPGTYNYSYRNKNTFNWILICVLYTPFRKLLEIFPLGRVKQTYLRLLGMKMD